LIYSIDLQLFLVPVLNFGGPFCGTFLRFPAAETSGEEAAKQFCQDVLYHQTDVPLPAPGFSE